MIDEALLARITVIVPAAGKGVRMGARKQWAQVNGQPLLHHTLSSMLQLGAREVVLVVSADDDGYKQVPLCQACRIVLGGATRADSVLAALTSMQVDRTDWVLVHDGARPCVRLEDIRHLIATVSDHEVGGILATPIVETVKQVVHGEIERTLDRRLLWAAQTPQMFRYGLLRDSLESVGASTSEITDDASALEIAGFHPRIVEGHSDNIKVTTPEDLLLASRILEYRSSP